jgi:hypothetical protein
LTAPAETAEIPARFGPGVNPVQIGGASAWAEIALAIIVLAIKLIFMWMPLPAERDRIRGRFSKLTG